MFRLSLCAVFVWLAAISTALAQDDPAARRARSARLVALGETYVRAGNPGPAIAYFRDALSVDPGIYEAYAGLARIYIDRGSVRDAQETLLAAIRRLPDRAGLWRLLADFHERQGAFDDAAAAIREALARDPDDLETLAKAASVARSRGSWTEALARYRQIVDLSERTTEIETAEAEARRYVAALARLSSIDPVGAAATTCDAASSPVLRALAGCVIRRAPRESDRGPSCEVGSPNSSRCRAPSPRPRNDARRSRTLGREDAPAPVARR